MTTNPSQASLIANYGTLIKSGSGLSDISNFGPAMHNYGLIRVEEGALRVTSDNHTHSGDFEILAEATMEFSGTQHFGATASITGDGNVSFPLMGGWHILEPGMTYQIGGWTTLACNSCAVRVHTDAVTGDLYIGNPSENWFPQLEGEGSLTVTGLFDWRQGVIGHTGNYFNTRPITVDAQGGMNLHSGVSRMTRDAVIHNHGEAIFSSGAFYLSHPSAQFINLPDATFEVRGAQDINYYWSAQDLPLGRFVNQGAYLKTGVGSATLTSIILQNSGNMDVEEGELIFRRRSGSSNPDGGARLVLEDGLVNTDAPLLFEEFARLHGSGTINGPVEVNDDIAPGFSTTPWQAGQITINGDLTKSETTRTLVKLVSSPSPGSGHDQVAVDGQAHIAGTLDVRLADGYNPFFGEEFVVLTCSLGCTGEFEALEFSPSEDDFELIYSANSITVRWIGESPVVVPNEFILFLPMTIR
jgi:hypothetical protein